MYIRPNEWIGIEDVGISCPVCGLNKFCQVTVENPHDPMAALCFRISKGSSQMVGDGHLHVLKPSH